MPIAAINHIELDERGIAYIAGTRLKVHILMSIMNVNKLNAEGLMDCYPSLTPAQVHAALAYYYDHQEEIDRRNKEANERAVEMQKQSEKEHPDLYRKLREAEAALKREDALRGKSA